MSDPTPLRLETPRLVLRELDEADAPFANAYERDPQAVRYVTHGVRTLEESLASIRENRAAARAQPRIIFDLAMTLREGGRLIGRAGMKLTTPDRREGMLWYILLRDHWGQGYAPEAARALLAFGFEELRLHRIFIDIDPRNLASARVGEKLGMRREAHLVENVFVKGEWCDTLLLGLLDREWKTQAPSAS